ncbi:MAG: fibronectin type III domain-containing protein [Candidatus Zixiibacteriota bacterium]|nr:MAG: fibronectin type III domain-containing protein [candidate division Zixibacteria bacterium]
MLMLLRIAKFIVFISALLLAISILPTQCVYSQGASPTSSDLGPITVRAHDTDNDAGSSITVEWDDPGYEKLDGFAGFLIWRTNTLTGTSDSVEVVPFGARSYDDRSVSDDSTYSYAVAALVNGERPMSAPSVQVRSAKQWFDSRLTWVLILGLIICGAVIYFIESAKRGTKLFLRRIAGLEAIDEAVGRATEMGRPILFVAGIQDMDDVQTIAGLTILGSIARTVAEYDTKINMPVRASLVMTAARETIKQAYITAGRPDGYNDDMVHYVTDEQFGFVAAVDGIMVRERPAACFFLGAFFAESLIMAETGNSIGAIQIAGTAMPAQLPFFVAACDYTLIGEELFAASAYLSGEPRQLGSLKGADVGKAIAMIVILVGVIATTIASAWNSESMLWIENLLRQMFSTG